MSNIDQQFIEFVVKSLVGKPDAVHVDRRIDEKGVLLELTVDPEDLGRVIGKRGATAQSLRTLLRALGTKNDARYNLKIVDNGIEGGTRSGDDDGADKPRDDAPKPSKRDKAVADTKTTEEALTETNDNEFNEEKATQEEESTDRLRRTREELAELDDLDV